MINVWIISVNYKHRLISEKLTRLTESFPVVVVSGARQVGKTTLINHLFPAWDTVTFDPVLDVGNARQDPELFLANHPCPLVLDEIQYAPELVPTIKRLVDKQKRPGMYLLTGSQEWSVLKTMAESLAGRAVFVDLAGFSLGEAAAQGDSPGWLGRYLRSPEQFLNDPPPAPLPWPHADRNPVAGKPAGCGHAVAGGAAPHIPVG